MTNGSQKFNDAEKKDWNGGMDYGMDYGILCTVDGTIVHCVQK